MGEFIGGILAGIGGTCLFWLCAVSSLNENHRKEKDGLTAQVARAESEKQKAVEGAVKEIYEYAAKERHGKYVLDPYTGKVEFGWFKVVNQHEDVASTKGDVVARGK